MIKGSTLTLYAVILLVLGLFGAGTIDLAMTVNPEVVAGNTFEVTVQVDKGAVESFARYQVELPRGLQAIEGSANNANFQFENQQVKFVWMRLPTSREFELKYTVRVDPRLRGTFSLGGQMSYISENTRRIASVEPVEVRIAPSPQTPLDKQLDLAEYQKSIPAQRDISMAASRVRCLRETPRPLGEGNDLVVRLLINRGEALKFAKVEEKVPAGFIAEPIETKDAIFSFEDGMVKFLWMTLPPEAMFTVSYRLIPESGNVGTIPKVQGSFSFVQDEATRVIPIQEKDLRLENMSRSELEKVVRESTLQQRRRIGQGGNTLEVQAPGVGGQEYEVTHQAIGATPPTRNTRTQSKRSSRGYNMDAHMLAPEEGVYYRVQVAAGHRPINVNRYFRRKNLKADVRTEKHDGWYKYSVGSFKEYKQARDYRVKLWNTTPIQDAFVAAYNNGRRITVQEALMITSQKWYK